MKHIASLNNIYEKDRKVSLGLEAGRRRFSKAKCVSQRLSFSPERERECVCTAVHHYIITSPTLSPHQEFFNGHCMIHTPSLPDAEVCQAVPAVKFIDPAALSGQRVECDKQAH